MPEPTPTSPERRPSSARLPRWLRGVLYGLAGTLAALVLLLALALSIVQTDWGAERVKHAVLDRLTLFEGAELQVDRLDGSFVRSLALYDARLVKDDGDVLARLDTLHVRYRLWPLLNGRVHVTEAYVAQPSLSMTQQEDSTWDLFNVLPRDTAEAEAPTTIAVQLDRFRLSEGRATARFYAPERDSSFHMENLNVRAHDVRYGDDLAFALDSLWLQTRPPGRTDTVDVRARAALDQGRFELAGLRLESSRSHVTGQGLLDLPTDTTTLEAVDFSLRADPLAFYDLHPFVPSLDPRHSLTLNVRARGGRGLIHATADGRVSDGATFSFSAAATPTAADTLRYRADGAIRRFDPGLFAGGAGAASGELNLDLHADLRGTAPDSLNGTVAVEAFESHLGGEALDRTRLLAAFTGGTADVHLTTGLRDATVTMQGTARPLDEVPSYDVHVRFRRLDVGRFVDAPEGEAPSLTSRLGGNLRVRGRGISRETIHLTATLDLLPSTFNRYHIEEGTLVARYAGETIDLQSQLVVPEGRIALGGTATLADEVRYEVTRGVIEDVDVAALAGDTTRSSVSATLAFRGYGADPSTMRIEDARLSVSDSYYGPYTLTAVEMSATLEDGLLDLTTHATTNAGSVRLRGRAQPFLETPRYRVTEGTFGDVDLGVLMQQPDQRSDLNGEIALAGAGVDPATMWLDASLTLAASQLNDQPIDEGAATVALDRGRLTFDVRSTFSDGGLQLAGVAHPFDDVPTFALREATIAHLDAGALLGRPDLQTDLNATLDAEGRGLELATMELTAQMNVQPSTVNDETIPGGHLDAVLADGVGRLDARLEFSEGRATARASGRFFDDDPSYEASGTLTRIDVGRLMPADTIAAAFSMHFEVAGRGLDLETMQATGQVEVTEAAYGGIRVPSARTQLRLEQGMLRVDTLYVQSNVARADASGHIALVDDGTGQTSDFSLVATSNDLAPLRSFVQAELLSVHQGRLEGHVYGPSHTLRFDATLGLESFVYDAVQVAGMRSSLAGTLDSTRTLTAAELVSEIDYVSAGTFTIDRSSVEALYRDEQVEFDVATTLDQRRDARVNGRVDLRPDHRRVYLSDLTMRLDRDEWRLLQEASISYGDEYRVRNFLIYTDQQQIALDGVVDLDGEQSLILTIEQFRTDAVTDLFELEGLGGTLSGALDLTGPASAPRIDGRLLLDLESFDEPVGTLQLDVEYDSLRMNLDALLTHRDQSTMTATGHVPMNLSLSADTADAAAPRPSLEGDVGQGEVSLTVHADMFSIGWARPFLDPGVIDRLDGQLTADLTVSGTLNQPVLEGSATLQDGLVGLPELGVRYQNISGRATFTGNQVLVRQVRLSSGRGRITGEGVINMPELTLGEFDISLSAENFLAVDSREYRIVTSGSLQLSGTTRAPQLRGDIRLVSADFYLTEVTASEEFESVELSPEDVRTLERRFGLRVTEADTTTFDFYAAATIEANIAMERDVWLRSRRNPEMNIQFTGRLDFQKEAYAEPQLFGAIDVIPERSFINQFGRRFNIETGSLTFNGPIADPQLNLEAQYEVRSRRAQEGVIITLSVEGHLDDLDLTLSSDPPMEMTNIVSYIAFGRPAGETFLLGGGGAGNANVDAGNNGENGFVGQAAGAAIGQLTGFFESLGAAELGLDVVEIRQEGLQGATITAGKYVSHRLFVAVSQPISLGNVNTTISASNTQVTLEYELFRWLLARVQRDGSTLRFNFLWEYAY